MNHFTSVIIIGIVIFNFFEIYHSKCLKPIDPGIDSEQEPFSECQTNEKEHTDRFLVIPWLGWSYSFKDIHSDLLKSIMKPWWKGPNVCETIDKKENSLYPTDDSYFYQYSQSCYESNMSYRCSEIKVENKTQIIKVITQECCLGYSRSNDDPFGCSKKIELKSFEEILDQNNATKLLKFARDSKFFDQLDPNKNYTIFVPINQAFDVLDNSTNEIFGSDEASYARNLLSSIIIPQRRSLETLNDDEYLTPLNNDSSISINVYSFLGEKDITIFNCAKITNADYQAKNGYVHFIDRLVPPVTKTLFQLLQENPELSIFTSLLIDVKKKILDMEIGHFTIFAFTNDGFEKLSGLQKNRILSKKSCMHNFIELHITPYLACSVILQDNLGLYMMSGDILKVQVLYNQTTLEKKMQLGNSNIIKKDIKGKNGVLYLIDQPILLRKHKEIEDILNDIGYQILGSYLQNGSLEMDLTKEDYSYVIPPLEIVKHFLKDANENDVKSFLKNHIGTIEGNRFVSLSGLQLRAVPHRSIGCSNIHQLIPICGGTLVFTDNLISSSNKSLLQVIESDPKLSSFLSMIRRVKIEHELQNLNNTMTIFAPDNELMNEESFDGLNSKALTNFVKSHFLAGYLCCNELAYHLRDLVAINSFKWQVENDKLYDQLFINNRPIVECNKMSSNGLVHVLGKNK